MKNKPRVLSSDDIFWYSRKDYLEILEYFINGSIQIDEFIKGFWQLQNESLDYLEYGDYEILVNFPLNSQSAGFREVISSINSVIEAELNVNFLELVEATTSEKFLREYIKDRYLPRIRRYCAEY